MAVADRLAELGITLSEPRRPGGLYVPAVRTGNLLYIAGQVNWTDDALSVEGKLGREVSIEDGKAAARLAAINCLAAAQGLLGSLDPIARVVRLMVYVASAEGFVRQSEVGNGASELLHDLFGEAGMGTRLSLGIAEVPRGAPVEVEVIFELRS